MSAHGRSKALTPQRDQREGYPMSHAALALLAASAVAACASPAPPAATPLAAPAAFAQSANTDAQPVAEFWRAFADADLSALVSEALDANRDLRVAVARVAEAQALEQGTQGLGRPTLDATAGANRSRFADNSGRPGTRNEFAAGIGAAWEIDLFGRVATEQRAARATVAAADATRRAVQVSVAAEVARNYFELRGLQEQLRVTRLDLAAQRDTLRLVEARASVGRGSQLDVERARVLVEGTAATVPQLETALVRNRLRLAVLTGNAPAALDGRLAEQKPLPGLPATPLAAIGSPQTLLQRRPDVAAAEQQWIAAQAQSDIARSRLWPNVTLSGSLGLNAGRIGDLGDSGTFVASLGANLLWAVIDNGQRRAQIGAADARQQAALAQFDAALLAALEDAEGAFVTYTRSQQRTEHLFAAAKAAEGAAKIARARFDAGVIDFLALLDAERELLLARDRLAQGQTLAATSLVGVYWALAGGW
jgi:multidrug efflux system outer membrane protein